MLLFAQKLSKPNTKQNLKVLIKILYNYMNVVSFCIFRYCSDLMLRNVSLLWPRSEERVLLLDRSEKRSIVMTSFWGNVACSGLVLRNIVMAPF